MQITRIVKGKRGGGYLVRLLWLYSDRLPLLAFSVDLNFTPVSLIAEFALSHVTLWFDRIFGKKWSIFQKNNFFQKEEEIFVNAKHAILWHQHVSANHDLTWRSSPGGKLILSQDTKINGCFASSLLTSFACFGCRWRKSFSHCLSMVLSSYSPTISSSKTPFFKAILSWHQLVSKCLFGREHSRGKCRETHKLRAHLEWLR